MLLLATLLSYSLVFPEQPNITIKITENKTSHSEIVFIAPHENESVANDYLREKIKSFGGKFIELRQHGKRLIQLNVEENIIIIDPNRIFTTLGRHATIKTLNPSLAPDSALFNLALAKSQQLAEFLLVNLGQANNSSNTSASWIAMHNNTDGFEGDGKGGEGSISIVHYQNKLVDGAKFLIAVHRSKQDEDNLFYVTKANDFQKMKKDGWNVVLESPQVKTDPNEDDGSLSIYANKIGVRYINIEAERKSELGGTDHTAEKQKMIDYIFKISER